MKFLLLFIFLLLSQTVYATFQAQGKAKLFGPSGVNTSQYSPWVMKQDGWGSYLMYYCKNTPINNVWRDRIWRIQNWSDGLGSPWTEDQIVIEGSDNQNDDLSCAMGVIIDPNTNVWHMYYVTANRNTPLTIYLYHATSSSGSAGTSWTKLGPVQGIAQPFPGYLDTPSPIWIDGKIVLYFIGDNDKHLYRTTSIDGQNFTQPQVVSAPSGAPHARVTYHNGKYYLVYSKPATGLYDPPTQIYISTSTDGQSFDPGTLLFQTNGSDWDEKYIWTPNLFIDKDNLFRVYYAGNSGNYSWWGENSSVGVRWFSNITGDLNNNGHVDIFDYNILVSKFGNPYTIFDYNTLVANFGKSN
ncbi:MAG: hypothetical protein AAB557_05045 [Patescibacteria group bacterium]